MVHLILSLVSRFCCLFSFLIEKLNIDNKYIKDLLLLLYFVDLGYYLYGE